LGTWHDEGGNSGAFLFDPGTSPAGAPRPQVVPVSDVWHEIGAPGEPAFGSAWENGKPPYICNAPEPQPAGCPTYNTAAFYKDALGVVHLKGTLQWDSSATFPDTKAFRLPPGYRTAKAAVFPAQATLGGCPSSICRFVLHDGFFELDFDLGVPLDLFYFSLDGLSFKADD
jgi:hypothetical protein